MRRLESTRGRSADEYAHSFMIHYLVCYTPAVSPRQIRSYSYEVTMHVFEFHPCLHLLNGPLICADILTDTSSYMSITVLLAVENESSKTLPATGCSNIVDDWLNGVSHHAYYYG